MASTENNFLDIINDDLCRCCLNISENKMVPIFEEDSSIPDVIMLVTSIEIKSTDKLPRHVCLNCIQKLSQTFAFKQQIEAADDKLRQCLTDSSQKIKPIDIEAEAIRSWLLKSFTDKENRTAIIEVVNSDGVLDENYIIRRRSSDVSGSDEEELYRNGDTDNEKSGDEVDLVNTKPISVLLSVEKDQNEPISKLPDTADCDYNCLKCKQMFASIELLETHNMRCRYLSSDVKNCESQKVECIQNSKQKIKSCLETDNKTPIVCKICNKKFKKLVLLTSHLKTHSEDRPFHCELCDAKFKHKSTLTTHLRIHTGEKPFVCTICGKCFIQSSNLSLHMRVHSGHRPHKCTYCDKKFTSTSSLKLHIRTHTGEKPYSCPTCGRKFARCQISIHMRTHTGSKPFACSLCDKSFSQKSNLTLHLRVHSGERSHKCPHCVKSFITAASLAVHVRTHTGEKPYSCSVCGKTFARHVLASHMRRHTGVKPFECSKCDKKFITSGQLNQHLNSHLRVKPFSCDICSKRYTSEKYYKDHLRTHSEGPQLLAEDSADELEEELFAEHA